VSLAVLLGFTCLVAFVYFQHFVYFYEQINDDDDNPALLCSSGGDQRGPAGEDVRQSAGGADWHRGLLGAVPRPGRTRTAGLRQAVRRPQNDEVQSATNDGQPAEQQGRAESLTSDLKVVGLLGPAS